MQDSNSCVDIGAHVNPLLVKGDVLTSRKLIIKKEVKLSPDPNIVKQ